MTLSWEFATHNCGVDVAGPELLKLPDAPMLVVRANDRFEESLELTIEDGSTDSPGYVTISIDCERLRALAAFLLMVADEQERC